MPLLRSYLAALDVWQKRYYFMLRDSEWAEHAARYVMLRLGAFYTEVGLTFQELYESADRKPEERRPLSSWLVMALQTWTIAELPGGIEGAFWHEKEPHGDNPTTDEELLGLVSALPTPENFSVISALPERVVKWLLYGGLQVRPSLVAPGTLADAGRDAWAYLAAEDGDFIPLAAGIGRDRGADYAAIRRWICWVGITERRIKEAGLTLPESLFIKHLPAAIMQQEAQLQPDMELLWAGLDKASRRV
jgi:hypothetical protein